MTEPPACFMTKSELIARLTRRIPGLSAADVRIAVGQILEGIAGALSAGRRVEIRGFGSFGFIYRRPRMLRNLQTGKPLSVTAKTLPHFRAGKVLRENVANNALSRKTYRLEDLLAETPPDTRFEEIDFGPPTGREII